MAGREEVFLEQARSADGRSPLYDRLWRALAGEPRLDELVDAYEWDTPLRVAAAFHYLVLGGDMSWDQVPGHVLEEHAPTIRRFLTEQNVQTNEVQRCWMLLPCFLEAAQRAGAETLHLIELGPSAGLNLLWDRYRYRYGAGDWGPGNAPLELEGEERGRVPAALLELRPRVRSRVGVDVAPIDVTTDEGARLLRAFVWPDQQWRLRRLDEAIRVVRADPPELLRADVVTELPRLLAGRPRDGLLLVYATNVLDYLGRDGRARVWDALAAAARERPVALVANAPAPESERTYHVLVVRRYPGGEPETLAHADFHGAWLDWRA